MGGNYQKGVFDQLMEVMQKLDAMDAAQKKDRAEINSLTCEVKSLRRENKTLRKKVEDLQLLNAENTDKIAQLTHENGILRTENERLKRKDKNNSTNSSLPPSSDEPGTRAVNTFNGRKPTTRKQGGQQGHTGHGLSPAIVEERIRCGDFQHRIESIGTGSGPYIKRYRLDLETKAVATEIRIYAGEDGKYHVPSELNGVVSYGESIRSIAAYLYSEGVVSNDRIAEFIRSLSGDTIGISDGCVYGYCRSFGNACKEACKAIEEELLDADEICTDATVISTNGKQSYIRNFSTANSVLYCGADKKDLETLKGFPILQRYAGLLMHDHETALYHFGTGHAECNVHLGRYLVKNTEETGNRWSHDLEMFLLSLNVKRKELIAKGVSAFRQTQLEHISRRYDELILSGLEANKHTKGRYAKAEEKTLLNRLKKYKAEHLLFIYDFRVHYSNNISEKDLRICKNREKMAGGFRTVEGRTMYCCIMSVIETMKRRGINLFRGISRMLSGEPVIN